MKNISSTIHLVFALIVLLIMGSCTTTREIHHQITLHDTVRLSQHDTVRQWHIQHDSIFLHDSIYWQGNQLVKERTHEHWQLSCMTPCIGYTSIPCFGLEIDKNNNALPLRRLRVTHSPLPYSLPSSALQWGECCEDTSESKVYNGLTTDLE